VDFAIVPSRRFGILRLPLSAVIDVPDGLPGVPGTRFALVATEGPFRWLQSTDDADVALPVCDPWAFFDEFRLVITDADAELLGLEPGHRDAEVWAIVRADGAESGWTANLRAPLVVFEGSGRQVLNDAPLAPVQAPLYPPAAADYAA
jgi:flagellar assembly factor FliW